MEEKIGRKGDRDEHYNSHKTKKPGAGQGKVLPQSTERNVVLQTL